MAKMAAARRYMASFLQPILSVNGAVAKFPTDEFDLSGKFVLPIPVAKREVLRVGV